MERTPSSARALNFGLIDDMSLFKKFTSKQRWRMLEQTAAPIHPQASSGLQLHILARFSFSTLRQNHFCLDGRKCPVRCQGNQPAKRPQSEANRGFLGLFGSESLRGRLGGHNAAVIDQSHRVQAEGIRRELFTEAHVVYQDEIEGCGRRWCFYFVQKINS